MYECFHCLCRSVIWDAYIDAEDYMYERPGIVHNLHCMNCGAEIQYFVPTDIEEDEEENE